ncbi:MAG: DUF2953 domain-containing protein [Oscillospiraceae bacterium]|nr:DUF2953 domain-containing protein [Oscillospiraceae bacterium]
MGWLVALAVLVLLSLIPIGVRLVYNEDGLVLSALLGFVKIKLYPKEKKEKKASQKKKTDKTPNEKSGTKQMQQKKGGKLSDLMPLVKLLVDFLGSLRRKLRVNKLELLVVMAGDDPCDLAINYGRAWTAVGNIMPLLERVFVIKRRNVQVDCDFLADTPRVIACVEVTITVGRILSLGVKHGIIILREYLKILKLKKGGALK